MIAKYHNLFSSPKMIARGHVMCVSMGVIDLK